jgi:hypothetical protein
MYTLVFDERGLNGLLTPDDQPDAATLAARYRFLRKLGKDLMKFDAAVKKAGGKDGDDSRE